MLEFNKKTNLLESIAQEYPLEEVKDPNLYRDYFSYDDIPKVAFNRRIVPMDVPDDIWITDTTFRDGQQSREPYTVEQMTKLFDMIHRLSGPNGVIRMSEFFLYTKKDQEAVYKCLEKGYRFPEITSWRRASKKDFELVRSNRIKGDGNTCKLFRLSYF